MAKIIAIVNQKGGVGKTTTVINVGAGLAMLGKKVLLVDLDPQGNLSAGLNIDPQWIEQKNSYFALLGSSSLAQNSVETTVKDLFVVPADSNLAGAEIELVDVQKREFQLRKSLSADLDYFDYVMIDCPPSLGLLTLNALTAADSFLIPLQSEFFALQGLMNILRTTKLVKQHFNPALEEEGILLTMFDSRSNLSKQVYNEVRSFAHERLFSHVIPRRVRLAESTSHGKPGIVYDPACFGARSYLEVAKELDLRNQGVKVVPPPATFVPPDPVDRIQQLKSQNKDKEVTL
jgi:chromosome partitioning protein